MEERDKADPRSSGLEPVVQQVRGDLQKKPLYEALLSALSLMSGGSPSKVKDDIQRKTAGKSNVCGKIWQNGDMAYRCRNCGYDEPCAVCVECFQDADHSGHDYLLITVSGGCCDCGDPLAWRPEGNCIHHKGFSDDFDPTEDLPVEFCATSRVVLKEVLVHFAHLIHRLALRVKDEVQKLEREEHAEPEEEEEEAGPASASAGGDVVMGESQPTSQPQSTPVATKEQEKAKGEPTKEADEEKLETLLEKVLHVIDWIIQLSKFFGDGMRRLISDALHAVPAPDSPLFETYIASSEPGELKGPAKELPAKDRLLYYLLVNDNVFPTVVSQQLNQWYFQLLGDGVYKRKFAVSFVTAYPTFIDVYREEKTKAPDSEYSTPMALSTQFLHPKLIPVLVREAHFLDLMLDKAFSLLTDAFLKDKETGQITKNPDTDGVINRQRVDWFLQHDLNAILLLPDTVKYLLLDDPSNGADSELNIEHPHPQQHFIKLLKLFALLQGSDPPEQRQLGAHVQFESMGFAAAFTWEIELLTPIIYRIAEGIRTLQEGDLAGFLRAVKDCHAAISLDTYQKKEDKKTKALPWASDLEVLDLSVADEKISFHVPLHRLLARLIIDGGNHWGIPLDAADKWGDKIASPENAMLLLEAPLCNQALAAQINAGMWARNGGQMHRQAHLYQTQVDVCQMYEQDIALLQCCATLLRNSQDLFMGTLFERFGVTNFFDWTPKLADISSITQEQQIGLAEGALELVIKMINERGVVGLPVEGEVGTSVILSDEESRKARYSADIVEGIRREFIHQLCAGPKTHSQLVKSLPSVMLKQKYEYLEDIAAMDLMEKVLAEVADFSAASVATSFTGALAPGKGQSTYSLKEHLWSQYDPYFLRYTPKQLEQSLETYLAHLQKVKGKNAVHGHPMPCPNLRPVPPLIRAGVASILQSRILLKAMFGVFLRALTEKQKKGDTLTLKWSSEQLLWESIALLKLILQFQKEELTNRMVENVEEVDEDMNVPQQVATLFDIKFPSEDDVVANMCHQVFIQQGSLAGTNESLLSILFALLELKDEDFADKKDALEEILSLVKKLPDSVASVRNAHKLIAQHERRKSGEENLSEEELRLRKIKESRDRQKAILAQFAAKQKQFLAETKMDTVDTTEDPLEAGKAGDLAVQAAIGTEGGEEEEVEACVMCKEGYLVNDPLGRLAYVQTSGVLGMAKKLSQQQQHQQHGVKDREPEGKGKEKEKGKEESSGEGEAAATATATTTTTTVEVSLEEGEEEEETKTEPKKETEEEKELKRRMRYLAEVTRNINDGANAHCFSCQHLMHVNCRHKYSLALLNDVQRMNDIYLPVSYRSIITGEFPCPLCRTLANTLIPVVPQHDRLQITLFKKQMEDEGEEEQQKKKKQREEEAYQSPLNRWLRELGGKEHVEEVEDHEMEDKGQEEAPLLEGEKEYRGALHDFASRVYAAQKGIALETVDEPASSLPPSLWSLVAAQLANMELASRVYTPSFAERERNTELQSVNPFKHMFEYCKVDKQMATVNAIKDMIYDHGDGDHLSSGNASEKRRAQDQRHDWLYQNLKELIFGERKANENSDTKEKEKEKEKENHEGLVVHPFMDVDMFGCLVRVFFLDLLTAKRRNRRLSLDEYPAVMQLFYLGVISQAILQLSSASTTTSSIELFFSRLIEGDRDATSQVELLTLTFLRQLALFVHTCAGEPAPTSYGEEPLYAEDEHRLLREYLSLPSIQALLVQARDTQPLLIKRWLYVEDTQQQAQQQQQPQQPRFAILDKGLPFELNKQSLPFMYQDLPLFTKSSEAKCKRCKTTPKPMALCLLCGDLLCFGLHCCQNSNGIGEINQHLEECGEGSGMFLLVQYSQTILMSKRKGEGCVWLSPYLDSHKEEDIGLTRGRPLFLDSARYHQLKMLWLEHKLPIVINANRSGTVRWNRI